MDGRKYYLSTKVMTTLMHGLFENDARIELLDQRLRLVYRKRKTGMGQKTSPKGQMSV